MPITSITRDTQNNVSIVRIITSDSLSTVTGANYIENEMPRIRSLNNGFWQWYASDMLLVSASDGNAFFTFTNGNFTTLAEYSGTGVQPFQIQNQQFTFSDDTGSANLVLLSLTPALTAYQDGQYVCFEAAADNTGPTDVNINGLGLSQILTNGNHALVGGEILSGGIYMIVYDNAIGNFILINSSLSSAGITAANIQQQAFTYAVDSGTANNYIVTLSPAPTGYPDGMYVCFKASHTNTGNSTINVNSLGTVAISYNNSLLNGGEIVANNTYMLVLNGTLGAFVLINSSLEGDVQPFQIQDQSFTYSLDTGSSNAVVLTLSPAIGAYSDGMFFSFAANSSNSGATTISINGLGTVPVVLDGNVALSGGEILSGRSYQIIYSGNYSAFVLLNPTTSAGVTAAQVQDQAFNYSTDSGVINAYVATLSPAPASYVAGLYLAFTPNNTNTGASTINVNGLGAVNIITNTNALLSGGEMLAGLTYYMIFEGGTFQLINQSNIVSSDQIQKQFFTYAVDTGAPSAVVITLSPAPSSYTDGMYVAFKAVASNGGATTINVNGLGFKNIVTNTNTNLIGGEILINGDYLLVYNSIFSAFVLINSSLSGSSVTAANIQQQAFTYAVDSGSANAYVVTLSPAPSSYTDGMYVAFKATNANSGSTTINVNGLGATNIVTNSNSALSGGEILVNGDYLLQYNSTFSAFVVINSSLSGGITAAQIQKQQFTFSAATGTNTYVVTLSPALSSYTGGDYVCFQPINANTGASTLNVNALGAKAIILSNGNALVGGELLAQKTYVAVYNSTANSFILLNPSNLVTPLSIQDQSYTFAVDTGSAGAYQVALSPAVTSLVSGLVVVFRSGQTTNTGACTLSVNGLTAHPIRLPNNGALVGGELITGLVTYVCIYTSSGGGLFTLLNPSTIAVSTSIQKQSYTYAVDSGSANAYAITLSPAPTSYVDGMYVCFRANQANTGASTINVNSIGTANIVTNSNAALIGGEILAVGDYILTYNSSFGAFVIVNSSLSGSTNAPISSVISSGSAVPLSAATNTNITSISVPAGRWLICGNATITLIGVAITGSELTGWISTTSATEPDISLEASISAPQGTNFAADDYGLTVPSQIFTFSTSTTVYLSSRATFSTGTATTCGGIYAIPV